MLKGISPLLSPELLIALHRMGHGDEIVIGDAHFPGHSLNAHVLRADGLSIPSLLDAILPLFPLDTYDLPLLMMEPVEGDAFDPLVEASYASLVQRHEGHATAFWRLERFAFYERSRRAFAVVMTGDTAKYANLILKKGLVV